MKENKATGFLRKGLHRVLSLGAVFALLFLFAFGGQASPTPVQVAAAPEGIAVKAMEEWDDLCLLAYTGNEGLGAVLALDRRTGAVQQERAFQNLAWAALRGGSLFVLEDNGETATLTQLSLPALETESSRTLQTAADSLVQFDCDSEGRVFFIQDGSLWMEDLTGNVEIVEPERLAGVTFLGITPLDGIFLATATHYYWGQVSQVDMLNEQRALFQPSFLVGEGYYIAFPGLLYRYEGDPVPGEILTTNPLFCAVDREGHLLYSKQGSTVECLDLAGDLGNLGSVELEGELLALCGSGAVTLEEGTLWFTPVQFFQETAAPTPTPTPTASPTPTPEPTPSETPGPTPSTTPTLEPPPSEEPTPTPEATPSPEPSPSPTIAPNPDGILWEGDTLVLQPGTTINQLLYYFQPDGVPVYRPDGSVVTSGALATAMTVEGYTLVVLGDCDGSGTVSQSDLLAAQSLLLENSETGTPYRRAADLDGDGQLSTLDLVLLSQAIQG